MVAEKKLKMSEALLEVKGRVAQPEMLNERTGWIEASEGHRYICNAAQYHLALPERIPVLRLVSQRLGQSWSVERWLNANVPSYRTWVEENAGEDLLQARIVQAYRHFWLDSLIAEFKAKGD